MIEVFSARTGFLAYRHMIFPIMRLFPNMTGNEMKRLWRKAWQSSVGQTIATGCSPSKPPCAMTIQWDDRAPAAIIAVDNDLSDKDKDDLNMLVDSVFHASHCILMLPIECYLRMQHVVRIEVDLLPPPSRN